MWESIVDIFVSKELVLVFNALIELVRAVVAVTLVSIPLIVVSNEAVLLCNAPKSVLILLTLVSNELVLVFNALIELVNAVVAVTFVSIADIFVSRELVLVFRAAIEPVLLWILPR